MNRIRKLPACRPGAPYPNAIVEMSSGNQQSLSANRNWFTNSPPYGYGGRIADKIVLPVRIIMSPTCSSRFFVGRNARSATARTTPSAPPVTGQRGTPLSSARKTTGSVLGGQLGTVAYPTPETASRAAWAVVCSDRFGREGSAGSACRRSGFGCLRSACLGRLRRRSAGRPRAVGQVQGRGARQLPEEAEAGQALDADRHGEERRQQAPAEPIRQRRLVQPQQHPSQPLRPE